VELELVTIAAGPFAMGSDDGAADERPVREVWVGAFAIAVLPVTNAQYAAFVADAGARPAGALADPRFALPEQPVVAVSWFDAVAYCAWLRARTGVACRLPTEAEREKAARGGFERRRYPWGDEPPPRDAAARTPLAAPPCVDRTRPNGYGLCHTGDLVHEWCSDWYAADWYRHAVPRDPIGPTEGTRRVSRGGSWRHQLPFSRCAARSSLPPDRTYTDYGFRVAASAAT
jgi:sulfatase modifying factor 1